jgi:transcriptional regulator with XRE-family HTH domain
MKDLRELGAAVAVRRKDHHLTQAELAHQSGVTRELIARFESGRVTELGARRLLAVTGGAWHGVDSYRDWNLWFLNSSKVVLNGKPSGV